MAEKTRLEIFRDKFIGYFELLNKINSLDEKKNKFGETSKDYQELLRLDYGLKNLVLTGEEIMEMGPIGYITDEEIKNTLIYETLEEACESLEQETSELRNENKRLKKEQKNYNLIKACMEDWRIENKDLEENLAKLTEERNNLINNKSKLNKIEKLVNGRQGLLINEIKNILYSKK